MHKKDTSDVLMSVLAIIFDGCAVFCGFIFATWIRFDSGWIPLVRGRPEGLYFLYAIGSCFSTLLFLAVFRSMGLFIRPQTGTFISKIPRLIKSVATGIILTVVLAFAVKNEADFARSVIAIAFFSISFFVILERYILFRIEWNVARHSKETNNVLILGTDSVASHLKRTLQREPMLRSKVIGFIRTDLSKPDKDIPPEQIKGTVEELSTFVSDNTVDHIILSGSSMNHNQIVDLILLCERNLIIFNMVPDLFRIITSSMDVYSLDDIPLLGIAVWPLDIFWNRVFKRIEDIVGSIIGIILSFPVIVTAAIFIKKSSPGPVFFKQERCGESGKTFFLYKLRTMYVNAEDKTGPVWAVENDPRTTKIGSFFRKYNIDELPQLWNVLKGHMSLVGPRPERPHFVEQFKEDVSRYMWRHVSKPGMTGWAQINGLRGNTSIEERVKYDLYYLENWSLAFDFKIILKTFYTHKNAY